MEQLGISALHPRAPEIFSYVALFSAPIDLDRVLEQLNALWGLDISGRWQQVPAGENHPAGSILDFTWQGVHVAMSPVNTPLTLEKAQLPEHVFQVPVTLYAPAKEAAAGELANESAFLTQIPEIRRRKRMLSAHFAATQLADALMREAAAVGIFRSEMGIVQPPQMVTELSGLLRAGKIPLPLWINIRTQEIDLSWGRTYGLPLFGHLDMEIRETPKSASAVYQILAEIANYLISGESYLLPGQTLESGGEKMAITEEVSPVDKQTVIRILT